MRALTELRIMGLVEKGGGDTKEMGSGWRGGTSRRGSDAGQGTRDGALMTLEGLSDETGGQYFFHTPYIVRFARGALLRLACLPSSHR